MDLVNTRRVLLALLLLIGFSVSGTAQIDLPRKQSKEEAEKVEQRKEAPRDARAQTGRGIVPHLVCSVCGELNYTAARTRPTEGGFYWAYCAACRRDRIHRPSEAGSSRDTLDLPSAPPGREAPGGPVPGARSPEQPTPAAAQRPRSRGDRAAAEAVYDAVRPIEALGDPLLDKGVESLLALGEDGLVASRVALQGGTPAELLVAQRVLLRSGHDEDVVRVLERLRGELPKRVGSRLLTELLELDPVHGSPEFLVEMLEHRDARIRQTAQRELRRRLSPALLPALTASLDAKRAETRYDVVELVAGIDDPAVLDHLLERIDDPSARVASRVVEAIAGLDGERVDLELEALAFQSRWILRKNAYALLAIMDREDLTLRPLLDERSVDALLGGLQSSDSFVYGACAAALAGIGFRARDPERTAWLDREVTGRLVAVCSGKEFHSDYSALLPRALRRLRLVTGVDFGSDGPAWARWWIESRDGFYARRVSLSLAGDRVRLLEVKYRSTGAHPALFTLFGPDIKEAALKSQSAAGEAIRMTELEARELAALLEREEVLGPDRLPGRRGAGGRGARTVEVLVDGRGKAFTFGGDASEPWFERIAAAVRELRDRNRWQRYPDLVRFATPREFWEVEAGWWAGDHTELERALRLKSLVLDAAPTSRPSSRSAAFEELSRLFQLDGVAETRDFQILLELLRDEGFYAERARRLVALCLRAARADSEGGPRVPQPAAAALVDLLNARFGLDAAQDMALVAGACGPQFVRSLARDDRPLVRTVAAAALGAAIQSGTENDANGEQALAADRALLIELLEDPEPMVEAAACLALGQARVEAARTDLLVRARVADPPVRAAALRAIGALGGEFVIEPLVIGTSAPEAEVRRAAAEGLVALNDPKAAPLLVSMLARGPESEVFEAAQRGLERLGPAAREELERVMNSPSHRARREATFLLSHQGNPRAAGVLIGFLADDPEDSAAAQELCVLTCVDFRETEDPAYQWQRWWGEVVHDDARAWLRGAMERRGVEAPPAPAFEGRGRRDGALFLLEVMRQPESWLVERGRRELGRLLERELELPSDELERVGVLERLRLEIVESYDA